MKIKVRKGNGIPVLFKRENKHKNKKKLSRQQLKQAGWDV
jgi:hypothetical protein